MSHTRMLSELAPSLVGQVSAEGRIKWVIVNHPTDSKLNSSDLIGRDCRDVLYQDNSDTGNCPIEATIITGIPQKAALPCTDGSKYLLKAYPVRNGSETIEGAMFAVEAMSETVTDGTEYSHYKAICDNSPYGKIILNLEPLSVIEINQAGLKLFGYTKLSSNDALQDILDATQISKSIEKILPEMKGQESINTKPEWPLFFRRNRW